MQREGLEGDAVRFTGWPDNGGQALHAELLATPAAQKTFSLGTKPLGAFPSGFIMHCAVPISCHCWAAFPAARAPSHPTHLKHKFPLKCFFP